MRATEIIRGVLDLIDQVDIIDQPVVEPAMAVHITKIQPTDDVVYPLSQDAEAINRYRQIIDLLPDEQDDMSPFTNTPNPKVADIAAVTSQSGDDVNKSKHPSDIRANTTSMFPHFQARE